MIKCPNCHAKHPENTLFCDECGHYLLGGEQRGTDPLIVSESALMEKEEVSEAAAKDATAPLGLRLTIPDSGRDIEVALTKEVIIGRLDPASSSFPEVDLFNNGALEKGVSRRHAKITREGKEVFIEDLGSLNGTFLNQEKLTPYFPQALKSGDELQLGRLTLRVSFT